LWQYDDILIGQLVLVGNIRESRSG